MVGVLLTKCELRKCGCVGDNEWRGLLFARSKKADKVKVSLGGGRHPAGGSFKRLSAMGGMHEQQLATSNVDAALALACSCTPQVIADFSQEPNIDNLLYCMGTRPAHGTDPEHPSSARTTAHGICQPSNPTNWAAAYSANPPEPALRTRVQLHIPGLGCRCL
jgi:hypothetical protein